MALLLIIFAVVGLVMAIYGANMDEDEGLFCFGLCVFCFFVGILIGMWFWWGGGEGGLK